ncbi:hypothetical protein fugu_012800 [Takifugu bimaculatus]|uniref:mRNA decay activator protein ZFP36 n=1 Tax=Takifugu bimaculatus TaxID=433685 RepID=A0A4Z2C6D0_9TELE|nr:hypothetical protein fugu_012800 [Takifugu bimaculatus]
MKEGTRQNIWGNDMSATVLSAFYDMDLLYKQDKMNMNALHINSMLDKKAVGAPVTTPCSGGSFAPGFFRRNSASNVEAMSNGNKYTMGSYSGLKENTGNSNTALMNKENKFRDRAYSESGERAALQQKHGSQINSTRYKTELCRPFEESGSCKYGEKCQFAHGFHELRSLSRHPKYKTEPCRTFHTIGFCPYGPRCHFIHNADERPPRAALERQRAGGRRQVRPGAVRLRPHGGPAAAAAAARLHPERQTKASPQPQLLRLLHPPRPGVAAARQPHVEDPAAARHRLLHLRLQLLRRRALSQLPVVHQRCLLLPHAGPKSLTGPPRRAHPQRVRQQPLPRRLLREPAERRVPAVPPRLQHQPFAGAALPQRVAGVRAPPQPAGLSLRPGELCERVPQLFREPQRLRVPESGRWKTVANLQQAVDF